MIRFVKCFENGSAHADSLLLDNLIKNKNTIEFNKLLQSNYIPNNSDEEIKFNYLKLLNNHYQDFSFLVENTIEKAEKSEHLLLPNLYLLYIDYLENHNEDKEYIFYMDKLKNYYLENENYYKLIDVYSNLANFYYINKNFHLALSYLNQIQFLPEKITNKTTDFYIYFLYGKIHFSLFSYEEANSFFKKSYTIYLNNKNIIKDNDIIELLYFLINNKINLKKFNEANIFLKESKNLVLNEEQKVNFSKLEIKILYKTELFNKAINKIEETKKIAFKKEDKIDLLIFQFYVLYESNSNSALLDNVVQELILYNPNEDNKDYNYIMYLYYKQKHNYELALIFFEKYQKIYSNFFENDFQYNINELRKSLENEVRESNLKITLKESKTNKILFEKNKKIQEQQSLIIICFLFIIVIFIIILVRNIFIKKKLKKYTQIDDLTKIYNRRFLSKIAHELHNEKNNYSLIIFDLDHFKKINDTYGHQFGDDVLVKVTEESRKILRNNDYFGRYGGEEFVVFLPNTNIQDAVEIAERIRLAISNIEFNYQDKIVNVTSSFGVNSFNDDLTVNEVFEIADKRLYKSKKDGRNKVSYEN